jgi:metallo-beta-lactamase class B
MKTPTRLTALVMTCLMITVLVKVSLGAQGRGSRGQAAAPQSQKEELSETYRGSQRNNVEYQKVAPIKLFDDLYYVGPGFVSVWLIPTTQGLILIDSAQEPYVDHVLDSIRKVGFDPKDIKYLVISHGHLDHFGGAARIQELSGARVGMLEEDWRLIDEAADAPANPNRPAARLPKRDLVFKEGDTLTLGNATLMFSKMPGHTPGSLSAGFMVHDGGKSYRAFMFGGPGPRGGVEGAEQFLASANRLAKMQGVQVAVQVHSWLNDYHYPKGSIFERAQKLAQRKAGDPNPFVDPDSWSLWVRQVQDGALRNLEAEKQKAAK